jgi:sensor c-di-GMP phosphodiesterase-like protein
MQGFYFSKPIAEAEFAAFLRKHLASSDKPMLPAQGV